MQSDRPKGQYIPDIVYFDNDENDNRSSIPMIQVPDGEEMPKILFIFESKLTGVFEPDSDGNESPVADLQLIQYANMNILKTKLQPDVYDKVRSALGLEDLATAMDKGSKINKNIQDNITSLTHKNDN